VAKVGISPWWYVPRHNDCEQVLKKELAPCWSCERDADEAARTIAPIVNELVEQHPTAIWSRGGGGGDGRDGGAGGGGSGMPPKVWVVTSSWGAPGARTAAQNRETGLST
jgi:hypothetical protein